METSETNGSGKTERLRKLEAENSELLESLSFLEDVRGRLVKIHELIQKIDPLNLDQIASIAVQKIPQLMGVRFASLFLYSEATGELVLHSQSPSRSLHPRLQSREHRSTVMGIALEQKKILHIVDFEEFQREHNLTLTRTFADKYATGSCICAPLRVGPSIVGILNYADKADGSVLDDWNDLPVVEQFALVLALAIRNNTLTKELQEHDRLDGMTHLPNYSVFHETLSKEVHRSQRYSRCLGLVLLDIDHLKTINDTYGQDYGDFVLVELSKLLREGLRKEDALFRHDGDEMAMILPETEHASMLIVAQRILKLIRQHPFEYKGTKLPITVSFGAAGLQPQMSVVDFVNAADDALFRAKMAGGNRCGIAGAKG